MKTQVTNLLTSEELIFVNDLSLTENIVNAIISNSKTTGNLLNVEYRDKIKQQFPIKESVSTITGKAFAYCEAKHLHAKFI